MSKYGVFSGPNTGKYRSENTPYLDTFHAVINVKDRGGLWQVNETAQNVFIECEKIFLCFTSKFHFVFKYSELVQEMQANSIVISNYDSLCYSIEPKVDKEICWKVYWNYL